jgi:hypothetical protein
MLKLNMIGTYISKQSIVYLLLTLSFTLLVASISIPYYTDSTGASSGVYWSGKDCLGFTGMNCDVIHVFPVLTIIFVCLTLLFMTSHVNIPLLSKIPVPLRIKTSVAKMKKASTVFGLSIPIVLPLAVLFAVITLATQLGMSLGGTSLADQAKNSSNTTTFKDGMALSASGVALVIFAFLIQIEAVAKLGNIFNRS